jgi:Cd2+/Zn2+-exporting ATPase
MIGRFSQLGVYRELLGSGELLKALAGGALALSGYLWDRGSTGPSTAGIALALASVALNGLPIVYGAIRGLTRRRANVDELVSLAIIASILYGDYLSAAVVSFIMVMGSIIEQATSDSARKAIRSLIDLSPKTATVIENAGDGSGSIARTVPISEVNAGDLLLMRPGERLPVDAIIRKGVTAVDESSMTGEPIPVEKTIGDAVYAGTLNQNGVIEIEVTRTGEDTTLGRIIRLVSEAERHKPRVARLVDRYAYFFTPAILACAGAAWLATCDMSRAITVLIVGCPCALILAAPTAIIATVGRAAKSGILVKGGSFLEEIGRADAILFDKTGTLTEGKPRVNDIVSIEGVEPRQVLASAACVEQNSTHPLAYAVLKAAHYARITIACAEEMFTEIGLGARALVGHRLIEVGSAYISGGGMSIPMPLRGHLETFKNRGATPLVVYEDHTPIGVISVADNVRPNAKDAVDALRCLGVERLGVVSGDHEKSARLISESLGLSDVWSELKPEEKTRPIRELQAEGRVVVFVGDGINDAPALATANVGIAMGAAGTDVALETADIALMNDDISKLPFLVHLSRRMLQVIKWNLAFSLVFNGMAVAAGGAGLLSPIMGALAHNIGSVIVVLCSASMAFASDKIPGCRPA